MIVHQIERDSGTEKPPASHFIPLQSSWALPPITASTPLGSLRLVSFLGSLV